MRKRKRIYRSIIKYTDLHQAVTSLNDAYNHWLWTTPEQVSLDGTVTREFIWWR